MDNNHDTRKFEELTALVQKSYRELCALLQDPALPAANRVWVQERLAYLEGQAREELAAFDAGAKTKAR